jgi:L-asparaginase II
MTNAVPMVEIWRGAFLESVHLGHAVICDEVGQIVRAWGDPDAVILPRSSCKMIQALPLVESGAADAAGLGTELLALASSSHLGEPMHTTRVRRWLASLDLADDALRCGRQFPGDAEARAAMTRAHEDACQYHNECSGKHTGFLTLSKHLGAGPEYAEPAHPVQLAVREAFEDVTGAASPGYGIDGCAAPNFATTVHGLARAMAYFARADVDNGPVRARSAARLVAAMMAHPEMVAGTTGACTQLMRAMAGRVAVKTGAEGVFVAILPEQKLGVALKITDGARRARECAIASILVHLGVLNPDHPATLLRSNAPILNRAGGVTGMIRPAEGMFSA